MKRVCVPVMRRETPSFPAFPSELVPQGELHHARLRKKSGIVSEGLRHLLQGRDACASLRSQARENIEAMKIRYVEDFPPELQTVSLPRHEPTLVERHVQSSIAISAHCVAGAALPRIGMNEVVECVRWGRKHTDGSVGLAEVTSLRTRDHGRDALLIPVCRPEIAIVYREGMPARPTRKTRKFPAPDKAVEHRSRISS